MSDRLALLLFYHEEDPEDAFTLFALAQEYVKRGETEKARIFYEQLQISSPDYTGTYYHLGKLHERSGRKKEAIATFERGIKVAEEQRMTKDLSELREALRQIQE